MRRARVRIALALALLGTCEPALGQPAELDEPEVERRRGDLVHILTGDVEIPEGTVRDGSVTCVGGKVRIRGEVTGDVSVVLGALEIDGGVVGGTVTGVLSDLELRDAEIDRDLVNILGTMDHERLRIGHEEFDLGVSREWLPSLLTVLTWLRVVGLLGVFVLVVLLVAIAPDRVRLIGEEAAVRYVNALLAGLLVYLVVLLLLLPFAIATLVGLPFLLLALGVLKWLGLAGIFHALGYRVGRALGRDVSPLGAVLLVYAAYVAVLLALSPWGAIGLAAIVLFHVLFFFFFEVPAVGLVLLTRAGTRAGAPPAPPPTVYHAGP